MLALAAAALMAASAPEDALSPAVDLNADTIVGLSRPAKTENGRPMGSEIVVRLRRDGQWHEVWRHPGLNPWKLTLADVDGDGTNEVVVGVWKKSRYDPVMEKRVFVYNWTGELLKPKWLGSRLSRRFDDFAFAPAGPDGARRLLALERGTGETHRISLYEWIGFGFKWTAGSQEMAGLQSLCSGADGVTAVGPNAEYAVDVSAAHIELQRKER